MSNISVGPAPKQIYLSSISLPNEFDSSWTGQAINDNHCICQSMNLVTHGFAMCSTLWRKDLQNRKHCRQLSNPNDWASSITLSQFSGLPF